MMMKELNDDEGVHLKSKREEPCKEACSAWALRETHGDRTQNIGYHRRTPVMGTIAELDTRP